MTILITGGCGYIGSHLSLYLSRLKIPHVILDDLSTASWMPSPLIPLITGDAGDSDLVKRTCAAFDIKAVFHLAGKSLVEESVLNPEKYLRGNLEVTIGLIDGIKEWPGVRAVVFSSTCAVYGDPQYLPIDESHPINPISPYGKFKYLSELALLDSGIPTAILRYFNAGGGILGEAHMPETHLIPLAARAILAGRPVEIFGTDYPTTDGTAIRDFVHVEDIAQAHIAALTWLDTNKDSNIWNLGSGHPRTVLDVVAEIESQAGKEATMQLLSRRMGDPPMLVASIAKVKKELGWSPTKPLEVMVEDILTILRSKVD